MKQLFPYIFVFLVMLIFFNIVNLFISDKLPFLMLVLFSLITTFATWVKQWFRNDA